CSIPFTDAAAIWNASTCLAFLAMNDFPLKEIAPLFADLPVLDMRLQLKEAQQNCLLINDSYSADLGTLRIALEFLDEHAGALSKTLILSDFLESGLSETNLYSAIANLVGTHQIDCFIGIGSALTRNKHLFGQKQLHFFETTSEFIQKFPLSDFHQQAILLKGARSFAFERIGKLLEKKAHQTVFEINLNALIHNLNVYRSLLKPKVKLMAMVKAFSYGAGSYEIARVLHANRVDYLTVAYADEGVVLRKAGIETPIMVMNPEPQSFDLLTQYNLEPEMYHFEILQAFIQSLNGEEASIHLELDSGMKRLGFDAHEIPALINVLQQHPNIMVKSIFTHLAASEDAVHDDFTLHQIQLFKQTSDLLLQAFPYPILRHCLNSGGIARFPDAQFDMVRLGIGLYGVNPAPNSLPLQAIGTLKTLISQVREISEQESIGYGRKGKLAQKGKIAIVAIGYADGLDRKLSNGVGAMLVNGKLAPIVGNICMDMTLLDVSHIDCAVGDVVIVFGENPDINQLSAQTGTIPYEILTGVSQRVKRVYFYE
ncbi:MAG: alanine racemase, partial [Bacteroidia bacterium]|nr:alanine racemase [Bacteroidia bacterium]